jgi:crotonobetainyl-CoA:carnitine CoA-transferase CaiB-like acyl-CoA transferase
MTEYQREESGHDYVRPLEGVRILDLTQVISGPYASQVLADWGAEVIKIEFPGQREGRQKTMPTLKGESLQFLSLNRNKKSLGLNLKSGKGRDIFYELTKKADVVFMNFRAGVENRLGIDYETLKKINPKIISCAITGFGNSGPLRDRPGFEPVFQAMAGTMSLVGDPPPMKVSYNVADISTGIWAAQGIMIALYQREKTGMGQRVEVNLLSTQIAFLAQKATEYLVTGVHPETVPAPKAFYQMYQSKDSWFLFHLGGALTFWPNLCRALGHPELEKDPRFLSLGKMKEHDVELTEIIKEIMLTRGAQEWEEIFVEAGVPCSRVNDIGQALSNPQVKHQNMVVSIDYQGSEFKVPGNPIQLQAMKPKYESPPTFAQHTEKILCQLLGFTRDQIEELRQKEVVY